MEIIVPTPIDILLSSQTGQFASYNALLQSGQLLYSWIVVGSGAGGGGISAAELAATGAKITSLSGFTTNISGYLDNRFSLTGSILDSKINSLSGYSNNAFATILNLSLTGSNLYNIITGLSGDDASRYATLVNVTLTGSNLQNQINLINSAGYITTGLADLRFVHLAGNETISGIKTFRAPLNIQTFAADGLVININGISGTYAGTTGAGNEVDIFDAQLKVVPNVVTIDWKSLILSGEWLTNAVGTNNFTIVNFQRLTSVSGALVSQISAAAAGVSTLNGLSGIVTLKGTGGLTVTTNGQNIIISGAASGALGGGGAPANANYVYLSGNQVITGQKVFVDNITASGNLVLGESSQVLFGAADGFADTAFTGHLSLDAEFFNYFINSGTGPVKDLLGFDWVNGRWFFDDSTSAIVLDLRNQFLSGVWRTTETGTDPNSLVVLTQLTGASGRLVTKASLFTSGNIMVFDASGNATDPGILPIQSVTISAGTGDVGKIALLDASGRHHISTTPAFSGDVSKVQGSGVLTLATVNATVGTFTNPTVTVNGKGLVTSISNGVAGGGGTGDIVSTLVSSIIYISGATTATLNRMHYCSGTTTGNYVVTLPSPTAGAFCGFKMLNSGMLSGLVTINYTGGSGVYYYNESAQYLADGQFWSPYIVRNIPMSTLMVATSGQPLLNGTNTLINLPLPYYNDGAIGDISNSTVTIRRDGKYNIQVMGSVDVLAVTKRLIIGVIKNGSLEIRFFRGNSANNDTSAGSAAGPLLLNAGDTIRLFIWTDNAGTSTEYFNPESRVFLGVTEIV